MIIDVSVYAINIHALLTEWQYIDQPSTSHTSRDLTIDDGKTYIKNLDNFTLVIDAEEGKVINRFSPGLYSPMYIDNTGIIAKSPVGVYKVNKNNGKIIWHKRFKEAMTRQVIQSNSDNTIFVVSENKNLIGIDRLSGKQIIEIQGNNLIEEVKVVSEYIVTRDNAGCVAIYNNTGEILKKMYAKRLILIQIL